MAEAARGGTGAVGRRTVGLVGLYDGPAEVLHAARAVRDAGYTDWDCHTPFPVHGMDEAMGLKPSRLPTYALIVGGVFAGLAFLMEWWMNAVDYPLRIDGKPLFSWPSWVPVTFEMFVLFTALATTVLATRFCGLWRWHSPLHDSGVVGEVTGSRFGVVLRSSDPRYDEAAARALLGGTGCHDVRTLFEDEDDGRTL